jgi:peptidoglycan/xylan/chitin deacetylase (PgdA/CDA1 family)
VRSPIGDALTVRPGAFAEQMRWLVRNGFHAVSILQFFGALEWGRRLPRRPVLITFDDGSYGLARFAALLHSDT